MGSYTIAAIADTHVPDRRRALHAKLLPKLKEANVQQILHAGDITLPRVLDELEAIAPVMAVRGNRDWIGFGKLPLASELRIQGKKLGLTHGHGGMLPYIKDKLVFLLVGPKPFRYFMERAISLLPEDLDVVVFGHNHAPMLVEVDGKLVMNPGSACCQIMDNVPPSFGLLHFRGDKVLGEIVLLE